MISDLAMTDIEQMIADGLAPTPRDIIRLNALGVAVSASRGNRVVDSIYLMPRVAQVTKTLAFRQPTIGHEIWMEKVERFVAEDYQTCLAVRAYALSRPAADLPDPDDPKAVETAVAAFAETCRDLTRDQIYAALDFAIFGADPDSGEKAATPPPDPSEPADEPPADWRECVAIGKLHEGHIILWGMTRKDLEGMTRQQLEAAIRLAHVYHNTPLKSAEGSAVAEYYATLHEIRDRLTADKRSAASAPSDAIPQTSQT